MTELKSVYDAGVPLTRDVLFPLTDRFYIQAFAWASEQPNVTRRYFNLNGETTHEATTPSGLGAALHVFALPARNGLLKHRWSHQGIVLIVN